MAAVLTLWRSVLRGLGLVGVLWAACPAIAADLPSDAAQPPPEIAAALPAAALQGHATMRFIGLAIYEVRLWAAAGFAPERYDTQPFALELRYARGLEGAAIAERSV